MTELVKYRLTTPMIDGPLLAHGAEAGLKILARVHEDHLSDGMGGEAVVRTLRICDWAGPWPEKQAPGDAFDVDPTAVLPALRPTWREAVQRFGYEAIEAEARLCYASYAVAVPQFTPWGRLTDAQRAGWCRVAVDALARREPVLS